MFHLHHNFYYSVCFIPLQFSFQLSAMNPINTSLLRSTCEPEWARKRGNNSYHDTGNGNTSTRKTTSAKQKNTYEKINNKDDDKVNSQDNKNTNNTLLQKEKVKKERCIIS